MKNLPVFITENGVASIELKQVPAWKTAYITIQNSPQANALLDECAGFCKSAGAENVYACGHSILESYPVYTQVWEMTGRAFCNPCHNVSLKSVGNEDEELFRGIYNRKMSGVPVAKYLEPRDISRYRECGYFVYEGSQLIGICILEGNKICAIASLVKGGGEKVISAISSRLNGKNFVVEVASANEKAVNLYTRLGLEKSKVLNTWYKIL